MATETNGIATYDDISNMFPYWNVSSAYTGTQCAPYSSVTSHTFAYVTGTTSYTEKQLVKYEDLGKIDIEPILSGRTISYSSIGNAQLLSSSGNNIAYIAIGGDTANTTSSRAGGVTVPFKIVGRDDAVWTGSNGDLYAYTDISFELDGSYLSGGTYSISVSKTKPSSSVGTGDFYVTISWDGVKYKYPPYSHPSNTFEFQLTKSFSTDILNCYDGMSKSYFFTFAAYRG